MSSCSLFSIFLNFRTTWRSWIRRNNFSEREYIRALKEEEIGWWLFSRQDEGEHVEKLRKRD